MNVPATFAEKTKKDASNMTIGDFPNTLLAIGIMELSGDGFSNDTKSAIEKLQFH